MSDGFEDLRDALQRLRSRDRARECLVQLEKPLETIAAWYRQAALRIAQLTELIESWPPVKGYESLLATDGYESLEAKFLATAALYAGKKRRAEVVAERRLASAIAALAEVHGRSSLVVSRRAKTLERTLREPSVEVSLWKAWFEARVLESSDQLDDLVANAMGRGAEACRRLTEIARALRPALRDPRGGVPTLASATHEAFLVLRDKGGYTYDDVRGDITDASTQATRAA